MANRARAMKSASREWLIRADSKWRTKSGRDHRLERRRRSLSD
jgi:hypothetical protein